MEEWKHIADGWPVRYDMETGGYIPYKPDNYSEYDSSSKSLIDNRPFPIEPAPQTDENDKPVAQTNDIYLAELQSNSEPLNRNYLFYDDNSSDWRRHSPNHDCTLCAEGREQAGAEKIRRRIIFISLICIVAVISFVYEKPIIDIIDSLFTTLFSVMSLLGLFGIIVIIGWIIWLIRFLITKPGGLPLREGLPPKGWRTDDGGKTWHP